MNYFNTQTTSHSYFRRNMKKKKYFLTNKISDFVFIDSLDSEYTLISLSSGFTDNKFLNKFDISQASLDF